VALLAKAIRVLNPVPDLNLDIGLKVVRCPSKDVYLNLGSKTLSE
jgi:hypothetical protein